MLRPDEGLIHAWLDGQLPADEAARVEQLIATDASWGAAAAEARGLVAASSRILSALDDVPRGVVPIGGTVSRSSRRLPWWTKAAAAIVVIAGGTTLVLQRVPAPTVAEVPRALVPVPAAVPAAMPPAMPPPALPVAPAATTMRRDVPKMDMVPKPERTEKIEKSSASVPSPQAQKPAISLQDVVPTGGVAPLDAARAMEQRAAAVTRQTTTAGQREVGGVATQRVAADRSIATTTAQPTVSQAAKASTVAPASALPAMTTGVCYVMRDSRSSVEVGILMRGDRQVGDTLFLFPMRTASSMRGWVMARDGVLRGVLTTAPEGRGMVLVTATPTSCPTP